MLTVVPPDQLLFLGFPASPFLPVTYHAAHASPEITAQSLSGWSRRTGFKLQVHIPWPLGGNSRHLALSILLADQGNIFIFHNRSLKSGVRRGDNCASSRSAHGTHISHANASRASSNVFYARCEKRKEFTCGLCANRESSQCHRNHESGRYLAWR